MGLKNFGQMPLYYAAIECLEENVVSNEVAENAAHLGIQGQVFFFHKLQQQGEFVLEETW